LAKILLRKRLCPRRHTGLDGQHWRKALHVNFWGIGCLGWAVLHLAKSGGAHNKCEDGQVDFFHCNKDWEFKKSAGCLSGALAACPVLS